MDYLTPARHRALDELLCRCARDWCLHQDRARLRSDHHRRIVRRIPCGDDNHRLGCRGVSMAPVFFPRNQDLPLTMVTVSLLSGCPKADLPSG